MTKRNARIDAVTAEAFQRAPAPGFRADNLFLHDPEQPHKTAEELYREAGGMTDPASMDHNCPLCHKTMSWALFQAHAEDCATRWYKTIDPSKRFYAGAAPLSTTIHAVPASADSGAKGI